MLKSMYSIVSYCIIILVTVYHVLLLNDDNIEFL